MFDPFFQLVLSNSHGTSGMLPHTIYGFVDGGYIRKIAEQNKVGQLDPRAMVDYVKNRNGLSDWKRGNLSRVTYYDAESAESNDSTLNANSQTPESIRLYWSRIEGLPDTHLGFGTIRGQRRPRQKAVDTLIAVDMLVGAFNRLYDVAVLIAGDEDFLPVVEEVKRRGCRVFLFAEEKSLSDVLKRSVDRFNAIEPDHLASLCLKYDS